MNALRSGEIVVFNGDRAVEGSVSAEAAFFGAPADFRVGPYLMASVTGSPVIKVYAMRDGVDRYTFFCSAARFVEKGPRQKRDEMLKSAAKDFAEALEAVLRKYPFQWYNFYPFWKNEA
jgi:predicted LPLAT superfamily acyltransferase